MIQVNKSEPGGLIEYYKLVDWWVVTFYEEEKEYIIRKYIPMGMTQSNLASGEIGYQRGNASIFLANLSAWFNTKNDIIIAKKIINKAEEIFDPNIDVNLLHFYYMHMIKFYYKDRENVESYQKAIKYCQKQIEISLEMKRIYLDEYPSSNLPSHTGFEQLSIIFEKENKLDDALNIAEKAFSEGWSGDWEKRIMKLKAKNKK